MSVNDQLQQAYQLIRAGNRQDAVQVLMPILRANPANADAWWLLANAVTDPTQKKRALEEVLKLRPNDDRARKMLDQLAPPPPSASFDLDDSAFNPPPAPITPPHAQPVSSGDVMPNWATKDDTPETVAGWPPAAQDDPFAGSSDPFGGSPDPFAPSEKPKNSMPPMASPPAGGYPAPMVPPAPVYMAPRRKGPSCCLIFSCLGILLICVLPSLCVGAGFAGLSPVFNEIAVTLGARDFQGLVNVFSGQATPLPGSALGEAFNELGVENFGQLQGTLEGFATLAGTPGLMETAGAAFDLSNIGIPLPGTPVNKGNIEVGQTVSGNVAPGSVGDGWIISLNAGQSIMATVDGVGGTDPTVAIVDGDNIVRAFNDDFSPDNTDAQITFTASSGGKYTIVVGTFTGSGGEYRLTVESQ